MLNNESVNIEKLIPATKNYLWGGKRLFQYGKTSTNDIIAESWELSFHDDGPCKLSNGKLLKDVCTEQDLGEKCKKFNFFPVLNKFIDAKDDLSIQVHPCDEYALKYENSYGKTEMWYVVDALENSYLYIGFNKDVSDAEIRERIKNNTLINIMNKIEVRKGDCYFIPSGTIHAIGKGCFIYEIQENSNLTYRVYDYDRVGKDGKKRELHIEKALKVLNKKKYIPNNISSENLANCEYFTVKRCLNVSKVSAPNDSFLALTIISGNGKIDNIVACAGDTFFVPAKKVANLDGKFEIITTTI